MSSSNHWPEMAFNMPYCRWKSFISWENYGDLQNRCRNVQPNNVDYLKCAVEDLLVLCELSKDGRSNRFQSKLSTLSSLRFIWWLLILKFDNGKPRIFSLPFCGLVMQMRLLRVNFSKPLKQRCRKVQPIHMEYLKCAMLSWKIC